jgi:hypothetical protein
MPKTKSRNMFRLLLSGGGDHFTGVTVAPTGVGRLLSVGLAGALAAAALPASSVVTGADWGCMRASNDERFALAA